MQRVPALMRRAFTLLRSGRPAPVLLEVPVDLAGVYTEGIRHVSRLDIDFAGELGYRIKLLGIARLTEHGLEQRVHPCMMRQGTPIAAVEGVYVLVSAWLLVSAWRGRRAAGQP